MKLQEHLRGADPAVAKIFLAIAEKARAVQRLFYTKIHDTQDTNQYGEQQIALDQAADELWVNLLSSLPEVKTIVSEEREGIIETGQQEGVGVALDPMDGVSSMKTNLGLGPIFGIYKDGVMIGQKPDIIAACYMLYGPLTTLVYSTGKGTHEFVLQEDNTWELRKENIKIPEGTIYVPSGDRAKYTPDHEQFIQHMEKNNGKVRCVGAMVADINNILTYGGVYCYPALQDKPEGKIRLLFECIPMAFLVEQAGGYASDGEQAILSLIPEKPNQRSPIYIGSHDLVKNINVKKPENKTR